MMPWVACRGAPPCYRKAASSLTRAPLRHQCRSPSSEAKSAALPVRAPPRPAPIVLTTARSLRMTAMAAEPFVRCDTSDAPPLRPEAGRRVIRPKAELCCGFADPTSKTQYRVKFGQHRPNARRGHPGEHDFHIESLVHRQNYCRTAPVRANGSSLSCLKRCQLRRSCFALVGRNRHSVMWSVSGRILSW